MPIPLNTNDIKVPAITTSESTFSKIINVVKNFKLSNQDEHCCLVQQDHLCCFNLVSLPLETNIIILNVLQKETDILLERWVMSVCDTADTVNTAYTADTADTMDTVITMNTVDTPVTTTSTLTNTASSAAIASTENNVMNLVEIISQFMRTMPNNVNNLYMIATCNDSQQQQQQQCCYTSSFQNRIDFRKEAKLTAERFCLNGFECKVIYDKNTISSSTTTMKKAFTLQSLSNPTFKSLTQMNYLQPQVEMQHNHHPLTKNSYIPITATNSNSSSNNNHCPTAFISVRRLSRLSLSAMRLSDDEQEEEPLAVTSPTSIPIPSPRMQYTHHHSRTTVAYSTSPINSTTASIPNMLLSPTTTFMDHYYELPPATRRNSFNEIQQNACLVGSFEESLLSGRMSSMPSKPITFTCQIGVLGYGDCKPSLKCPAHWSIQFPATFYRFASSNSSKDNDSNTSTPYVGTVDIEDYVKNHLGKATAVTPGYRIPTKGQLQIIIKNPNKTAVKLFLIPYDFTDMPKNSKTFLRQKSYTTTEQPQHELLRYAIHIQFFRNEKKRIYLYKNIRVVFTNRMLDAREKLKVVCEGPNEPVYRDSNLK